MKPFVCFQRMLKPLTVRGETVSNAVKRKLLRNSELDEETQTDNMLPYLIAQLGKGSTNSADKRITGDEFLEITWNKIEEMQYQAGGAVTFLEANNEDKLLDFYKVNRFQQFDTRQTVANNAEPRELVQLLRLL